MGGGSSTRHGRAGRPAREPALSELDLRFLDLLFAHRVLTQTQLAAISAGVPARTLRYRCNRLAKHGLLVAPVGSMSHRRLKRKAAGYVEYAKAGAWREPHHFCPALLFITTTEKRARSFLAAISREMGDDATLLTCACDLARTLSHCATETRWLIDGYEEPVDLLSALSEARRPYDEEVARWEAQHREEEAERKRLLADPEALRSHLRRWQHRDWGIKRLGDAAAAALAITLEMDGELDRVEHEALAALGGMFADLHVPQLSEREPDVTERQAIEALAHHHRDEQLERIDGIVGRFGDVPSQSPTGRSNRRRRAPSRRSCRRRSR